MNKCSDILKVGAIISKELKSKKNDYWILLITLADSQSLIVGKIICEKGVANYVNCPT